MAKAVQELPPPGGRGLRIESTDGLIQFYGFGEAHLHTPDTTDRAVTQDQSRWQRTIDIYNAVVTILALILAITAAALLGLLAVLIA